LEVAWDDRTTATISRVGFLSASVAFLAALGFAVTQIFRVLGLLGTPLDEILIYGFSLFIATPFMPPSA